MTTPPLTGAEAFRIDSRFSETGGVPLSVCSVELGDASGPDALTDLLTRGVFDVIDFLNGAPSRSSGRGAAVVAIELPESPPPAVLPGQLAFVEAVRGLVQSLVLEQGTGAPAVNIVVSTVDGRASRDRTVEYLASDNGRFSRGSTYDLRGER